MHNHQNLVAILLVLTIAVSSLPLFTQVTKAASDGWTLVSDAQTVKGSPDLREYSWQKTANMPSSNPYTKQAVANGPYDKIGLHRLVKPGIATKGAVFMIPTVYGSGEQLMSNPTQSSYNVDEASNQLIYWANRDFDVYSIDTRAHFLPMTMNLSQASSIVVNWGWDQWISDIKECVDKSKEISGFGKVFMAGMGWGGTPQLFYASQYWKDDLKGLILLDGGENAAKYSATNTANATSSIQNAVAANTIAYENPRRPGGTAPNLPSGMIFCYQNAAQNATAPAEWPIGTPLQPKTNPMTNKTWTNITEFIGYDQYATKYSNLYAGYGNLTVIIQRMAKENRYYPYRLTIESNAVHNWNNCPYVSYDYDDHFKEINVPVLGFRDELLALPTYGNFTNGLATTDFTQVTLPKYGHNDVYTGTNSPRDVSEIAYQWMINHYRPPAASAFNSVTVFAGQSWYFFVHSNGGLGAHSYQWYEGTTLLQGQTSMVLVASKATQGSYNYYCKVTDAEGTTVSSNTIVLTVR